MREREKKDMIHLSCMWLFGWKMSGDADGVDERREREQEARIGAYCKWVLGEMNDLEWLSP
jgi:hypothetical protein